MYVLFSTAFVCEHKSLKIRCDEDRIIDVISANYGRLDRLTCQNSQMQNINCRASNSLAKVQEICQNQSSCILTPNNGIFGGDPCTGTYKYLRVEYMCDN